MEIRAATLKYAWSGSGIVRSGFLSVVALKQHQRQEQVYFLNDSSKKPSCFILNHDSKRLSPRLKILNCLHILLIRSPSLNSSPLGKMRNHFFLIAFIISLVPSRYQTTHLGLKQDRFLVQLVNHCEAVKNNIKDSSLSFGKMMI